MPKRAISQVPPTFGFRSHSEDFIFEAKKPSVKMGSSTPVDKVEEVVAMAKDQVVEEAKENLAQTTTTATKAVLPRRPKT